MKRVSPQEAADLLSRGYTYLDVRSIPEFESGRPTGAVNVPLLHSDKRSGRSSPNPDFLAVIKAAFPPGSKLVIACQGGKRSVKAAKLLEDNGYTDLYEQRAGFGGARDFLGRLIEKGWADSGLPVETGPAPGRDWESMSKRTAAAS